MVRYVYGIYFIYFSIFSSHHSVIDDPLRIVLADNASYFFLDRFRTLPRLIEVFFGHIFQFGNVSSVHVRASNQKQTTPKMYTLFRVRFKNKNPD